MGVEIAPPDDVAAVGIDAQEIVSAASSARVEAIADDRERGVAMGNGGVPENSRSGQEIEFLAERGVMIRPAETGPVVVLRVLEGGKRRGDEDGRRGGDLAQNRAAGNGKSLLLIHGESPFH